MTSFDDASAVKPAGELAWTGEVPDDWAQGRTTFGGLVAAMVTRVAAEVAGPDRPLRTLDIAFVAPIPAGPVEIDCEVLGSGRSVTQLAVSVRSGEVLGARATVVLGAGRESSIRLEPARTSRNGSARPDKQGLQMTYVEGVMPTFTQHFDMRWVSDSFPWTGAPPEGALIDGWTRHRTPATGFEAVVSLLDAWPPAVLPMAPGPTNGSTVRWTAHAVGTVPPGAEQDWFWYEARTIAAGDGYGTTTARLYSGGELVLWSEQLVAVFDRPAKKD